jgi:hypothetical protein
MDPSALIRRFWANSEHVRTTELILVCLVSVAFLAIVARKIRVPYPILLTLVG